MCVRKTNHNGLKWSCAMFKVDDIVTYGVNGVCKIVEVEEMNLMGEKKTYLILQSLQNDTSTYFVPVDNENLLNKMRKLLSKDEVNQLIDSIPNEKIVWIDNERERKECYKKVLSDGKHSELIKMIKAIYTEKREREATGKKLHLSDEKFLKDAEKLLYTEFQYVLELTEQEMMSYIFSRIDNQR